MNNLFPFYFRKIIFLAVEVWVDVLGFVKRIQLARGVCLINLRIYEICWPRLHGNQVVAHEVGPIVIGYRDALGQPTTGLLLLKDYKKVPFAECPPPGYITGFKHIRINILDHQVLAFFTLIAPRITRNTIIIYFVMQMSDLDENQVASVNQLLQLFREKIPTIHSIYFERCLSNIQFLPDVDNKMERIDCWGIEESDVPNLIGLLASPRADGQQRVMNIKFWFGQFPLVQKLLDAIKEEFRASNNPVPQPFFLKFSLANLDIPQSEEQNLQTDETLTIRPRGIHCLDICRHPRGQYEQWAEDARKRLIIEWPMFTTDIIVDISGFRVPFSMDSI